MNHLSRIINSQVVAPPPSIVHILAVGYDLNRPGQNHPGLTDKLDDLGAIRIQQSLWWTAVSLGVFDFRRLLLPFVDYNDSLMVMEVASFAGYERDPVVQAWIERHAIAAGMSITSAL